MSNASAQSEEQASHQQQPTTADRLLRKFTDKLILSIDEPASLAQKLFGDELISHSDYAKAISESRPSDQRTRELLDSVYNKTRLDGDSLGVFLTKLDQLPPTQTLSRVRDDLKREHGECFQILTLV